MLVYSNHHDAIFAAHQCAKYVGKRYRVYKSWNHWEIQSINKPIETPFVGNLDDIDPMIIPNPLKSF